MSKRKKGKNSGGVFDTPPEVVKGTENSEEHEEAGSDTKEKEAGNIIEAERGTENSEECGTSGASIEEKKAGTETDGNVEASESKRGTENSEEYETSGVDIEKDTENTNNKQGEGSFASSDIIETVENSASRVEIISDVADVRFTFGGGGEVIRFSNENNADDANESLENAPVTTEENSEGTISTSQSEGSSDTEKSGETQENSTEGTDSTENMDVVSEGKNGSADENRDIDFKNETSNGSDRTDRTYSVLRAATCALGVLIFIFSFYIIKAYCSDTKERLRQNITLNGVSFDMSMKEAYDLVIEDNMVIAYNDGMEIARFAVREFDGDAKDFKEILEEKYGSVNQEDYMGYSRFTLNEIENADPVYFVEDKYITCSNVASFNVGEIEIVVMEKEAE